MVINQKNFKQCANDLSITTKEGIKELRDICIKKSWKDYHTSGYHPCHAIADWLKDIDKVLNKYSGLYFGVEGIRDPEVVEYINAGDSYTTTILFYKGKLRLGCIGNILEKAFLK